MYQGDQDFATWLHDQGYQFEGRQFRLFGFSRLDLRPYDRRGDRMVMRGNHASLQLGFALPESGQHFLRGLFAEQTFPLGDQKTMVDFQVESIELQPVPDWGNRSSPSSHAETLRGGTKGPSSIYRASNPICVSRPRPDGKADYLHPDEPDYVERLYQNLMNKMQSYTLAVGGMAMPIPPYDPALFDLEILSEPRSQLITIAVGTPRETEVRGYRYDFRLHCDPSWQEFVWNVGLGEKNSQGFGFVEVR